MFSISRFSVVVGFRRIIRSENRNKDFLHSSCSDCPSILGRWAVSCNFFVCVDCLASMCGQSWLTQIRFHFCTRCCISRKLHFWIEWVSGLVDVNAVCSFFFLYCYEDLMCSCTRVNVSVNKYICSLEKPNAHRRRTTPQKVLLWILGAFLVCTWPFHPTRTLPNCSILNGYGPVLTEVQVLVFKFCAI